MFYCYSCTNVNTTTKAPFTHNLRKFGWGYFEDEGLVLCPKCIAKKKLKLDDEKGELYK